MCALGYSLESSKIQCVEQTTGSKKEESALAVFEFASDIEEPFTVSAP